MKLLDISKYLNANVSALLPALASAMYLAYAFRRALLWNPISTIDVSANIIIASFGILLLFGVICLTGAHIPKRITIIAIPIGIILLLGILQWMQSVDPLRAGTMYILLLLSCAFMSCFVALKSSKNLRRINNAIVITISLSAWISLAAYIEAALSLNQIRENRELWKPEFVYEFTHGKFLQFEGFTGDPNFVGTIFAPALLLAVWKGSEKYRGIKFLVVMMPIMLCLGLSMSRGMIAAIIISIAVMYVLALCMDNAEIKQYVSRLVWYVLVIPVLGALPVMLLVDVPSITDMLARFEYRPGQRMENWLLAWQAINERPFLGHGLRMGEELLGGNYLENTYLDLWVEYGVVGLILVIAIIGISCIEGVSYCRKIPECIPWIHIVVFFAIQMMYRSMLYNFLLWMAVGIVLGCGYLVLNRCAYRIEQQMEG